MPVPITFLLDLAPLPGQDFLFTSFYSHTSLLQSCLWAEKNAPNCMSRLCRARLNLVCYCDIKSIRKVWYFSPHLRLPEPWWLLPFDFLIPALLGKQSTSDMFFKFFTILQNEKLYLTDFYIWNRYFETTLHFKYRLVRNAEEWNPDLDTPLA